MNLSPQQGASNSRKVCVLFFIKAPAPGKVKTRLGTVIGHQQATALYTCFVEDLLVMLQQLAVDRLIFFAPAQQRSSVMAWLGPQHLYYPQQGQDLGQRMANAFEQAFQLGYQRVLIMGSDSPDLPSAYVQDALIALERNQVVLGPSQDGGYYTLGFSRTNFVTAVFQEIPWSTAAVCDQTLEILHQQQRQVHQLPKWYDVDTLEDLWQFYQRNQVCSHPTRSLQYLNQHRQDLFDECHA